MIWHVCCHVCVCVFVHTFACVGLFVRRRPYVSRWADNCRVCGQSLYFMAIQPSCSDVISHMTICVWKGHCERLYSITRPLYVAASSYISWRLNASALLSFSGLWNRSYGNSTFDWNTSAWGRFKKSIHSTNRYWHTRKNTSTEWTTERPPWTITQVGKWFTYYSCIMHGALNLEKWDVQALLRCLLSFCCILCPRGVLRPSGELLPGSQLASNKCHLLDG